MISRGLLCLALGLSLSLLGAAPTAARIGGCAVFGRTPTSTAYLPNVTRSLGGPGGWETPFIVQNVGDAPTTIEINFANILDGSQPDRPSSLADRCLEGVSLAPGRSFALIPSTFADLPDNTSWAVTVFSYGSKIVGLVNEQRGVGDQQEAMAYSGVNSGATKVYLPNAADDYFGYQTPIIIENVGTQDAIVEASFVSFDGAQTRLVQLGRIVPFRSAVIDPQDAPGGSAGFVAGTQYSVTITSTQPVAVVQNSSRLRGGPHVSSSYNGLSQGAPRLWAPYFTVTGGRPDGSSPVAVQNVGTAASVPFVTVYLNAPGATSPACALGVCTYAFTGPSVDPGRSWVFDPREFACSRGGSSAGCLPDNSIGGAQIESRLVTGTGANAGATTFDPNGRLAAVVLPTSDTTAMAYQARPAATTSYLPNVTRTLGGPDGWTTPIRLVGTGSVTLKWYRFGDGALVATQQVILGSFCCGEAGAFRTRAVTVDPRSVPELSDDTQYSVVVQDSTAVGSTFAAVVTEVAAGGDNAMAYEGFQAP